MKKEINIYNHNNTKLVAFIDTNDVVGMTEIEVRPNEDGTTDRRFVLALANGKTTPFSVDEDTYEELKTEILAR